MNVSFIPADGTKPLPLLVKGEPEKVDEERALEIITQEDLEINVDLGIGSETAKYWTCDFSYVSRHLSSTCSIAHSMTGIREDQRGLQDLIYYAACIRTIYYTVVRDGGIRGVFAT